MKTINPRHRDHGRHELALRMLRHAARTRTISECTGLSEDRIRRLYKTYACELKAENVRRRRGKAPRRISFFIRNTHMQFEASLLASSFTAFGLLHAQHGENSSKGEGAAEVGSVEYGSLFCDAYETHMQLLNNTRMSFEHAWFLLDLLNRNADLHGVRCRHCDSYYLKDRFNLCQHACPTCKLKRYGTRCSTARLQRIVDATSRSGAMG